MERSGSLNRVLLWKKDLRVSLDTNRVTSAPPALWGPHVCRHPSKKSGSPSTRAAITVGGSQGASIPCFEGTVWVADRNLIVSKRGDKGRVLTYLRALNAQLANRLSRAEQN